MCLVIDTRATAAWRAAGEVWKPVSSRAIMARLKWTRQWWQRSGETFATIICVYAPTAKSPPEAKSQFSNNCRIHLMMFLRVTPL